MSAIITRTISSVVDQRLSISNQGWARQFASGNNWNRRRIGLRLCANPNGSTSDITGSPGFAFGFGSGTTKFYGKASVDHFIGVASVATVWEYENNGDGTPRYENNSASWTARRRVGSTNTDVNMAKILELTAHPSAYRNAFFCELVKGSPNFTLRFMSPNNSGGAQADVSESLFLEALEKSTMTVTGLPSNYSIEEETIASVDEGAAGPLDAVNIYWGLSSRLLEISDVAYADFLD